MTRELRYYFDEFSRAYLWEEGQSEGFFAPVVLEDLALSKELIDEGNELLTDWCSVPHTEATEIRSHWSYEEKEIFKKNKDIFYQKLVKELGSEYVVLQVEDLSYP